MENLNIFVDAGTDVGTTKKVNQDNILVKIGSVENNDFGLFVVCDGIGGLSKGEYASLISVQKIKEWWDKEIIHILKMDSIDDVIKNMNLIITRINIYVRLYGVDAGIKLGTTMSILLIKNSRYYIANVGDSRVYKYDGEISMLTEDHSLVNLMIDNGTLSREEAINFKKKNIITQCIGVNETLKVFNKSGDINNNNVFLIASDGFYNKIYKDELEKILYKFNKKNNEPIVGKWIEEVKNRGERDNISAIVIDCKTAKNNLKNRILDLFNF